MCNNHPLCCVLTHRYNQLQVQHSSQVAELGGLMKLKCLELERTKVLYEEASQNLLHCETLKEQQTKRNEVSYAIPYSLAAP